MFNNGVNTHGLRWRPRLKVWKSSNNVFDPAKLEAHSYGWWCYFRVIKGLRVFNTYYYSQATSQHQRELREVLRKLRIKIDLEIETPSCLSTLKNADLEGEYSEVFAMEVAARRKRIRPETARQYIKAANEARKRVAKLRKLGLKCSKARQAELLREAEQRERERLERLRSHNDLEREQARVMRRERADVLNNSWINVA